MSVNSDPVVTRESSYEAYCPKTANANFLNQAVEGTGDPVALTSSILATVLVPCNPAVDNIPILDPALNTESKSTAGDGLSKGEVYDKGYSDGSGSKRSYCIFGLHIKDTLGTITAAAITGTVAEISTVACIASDGSNLNSKYFYFDGIDADGNKPVVKYYVWIDINNTGADPAITGRTAVEVDIAAGVVADTVVATAVAAAIDLLDDFGAVAVAEVVTITNATVGAVDDVYDAGSTGFTFTVTVDGVSTKVLSESTTFPNIALHVERELTGEDMRDDYYGITQVEYMWECEEGGLIEEERNYLIAMPGPAAASDLARPISPNGTAWTTAQHPYTNYKKNFAWGGFTFTFEYDSADVPVKIKSFKLKAEIEVDYKRNNGSTYSNGLQIKARRYELTMLVSPTGKLIRNLSRLHYKDYATALTLTVKAQRGADTNDYIQWVFTNLMLKPYDQFIPVDPYYEEFDLVMEDAPGNTTTCTVKGYLSQQYYGVD